MLLASSDAEAQVLLERQAMLQEHGIKTRFADPQEVSRLEPALSSSAGPGSTIIKGALITPADAQIVSPLRV
jgi:L-2-hydroxyglutarate oxidase LhgO